jgi:RCC1 and BTB domain-containing protein
VDYNWEDGILILTETVDAVVSGELYTWGGGMYGKLGHGNETGHSTPFLVEALKSQPVRQVACGSRHTVVLLESTDVFAWGDKENGVSGHGDTDGHQYLPSAVEELRGKYVKQISACGFHTAALTGAYFETEVDTTIEDS